MYMQLIIILNKVLFMLNSKKIIQKRTCVKKYQIESYFNRFLFQFHLFHIQATKWFKYGIEIFCKCYLNLFCYWLPKEVENCNIFS